MLGKIPNVRIPVNLEDRQPRPLLIVFDNPDDAQMVLKKRELLQKSNVNIKQDQTPMQRKFMATVVAELKTRKAKGEQNIEIKFRAGIPQIVQA